MKNRQIEGSKEGHFDYQSKKKKHEKKKGTEVVSFDCQNFFHCMMYQLLVAEDLLWNDGPTERDEASYQVCFELFRLSFRLPEDDSVSVSSYWYYFNNKVIAYVSKYGTPQKWSDVYNHGLSERKFQQNVDLKVHLMRNARVAMKRNADKKQEVVKKIAEWKGISEYEALLLYFKITRR